ncbi:unnamed protein product [Mycena citricolor]|uniref:Uncharacterized protein n=1 Tax=Mycena citricolor TaxID=2018698 RepID=A0AAD2HM35_9AGAR|nr:unnamed protein product [Mycena citricolor]
MKQRHHSTQSSDTEPDTEDEASTSQIPIYDSKPAAPTAKNSIIDCIETIQFFDLALLQSEALCEESAAHTKLASAASSILEFLDSFSSQSNSSMDIQDQYPSSLVQFGQLVDVTFFETLFEQRKIFHNIAALSLGVSSGPIVCWVDSFLSKISDALGMVATGLQITWYFPGSLELREEEGLRIASQIPLNWSDVPEILVSEQASPAAKRLALRLIFSSYVVGPQLRGETIAIPSALSDTLTNYLASTRSAGFSSSFVGEDLQLQERLHFSMIVSLFANAEFGTSDARVRPHTLGCLLNVLQHVLHPQDTVSSLPLICPPDELDAPLVILFRWGNTVQWCFETWDDPRVAGSESITYLTSMWLLHTESELHSCSTGVSIAVLRVIHQAVLSLSSSGKLSRQVVKAASTYASTCIDYLSFRQIQEERWITHAFCKYLCSVFVLLDSEYEDDCEAHDYILEALSRVDRQTLGDCLSNLKGDSELRFVERVIDRLTRIRNLLSADTLLVGQETLQLIRSELNFLVILWHAGLKDLFPTPLILSVLSSAFKIADQCNGAKLVLAESLITASCAARCDVLLSDQVNESVWQISLQTASLGVLGIYHAESTVSALIYHESEFRAICPAIKDLSGSTVLRRSMGLAVSSLVIDSQASFRWHSRAACSACLPVICRALLRLLEADAGSTQFMISTPFTLNLCSELANVCQGRKIGEYFGFLRQRIEEASSQLLSHIQMKSKLEVSTTIPATDVPIRLLFYRHESSHLLLISDR